MGIGPKIGRSVYSEHDTPKAEVLGELKAKPPEMPVWNDDELKAQIAMEEGPPPWETEASGSDARQFIKCPSEWVLYWINPKQLDMVGWRGWNPVKVSDPRVKCFVPAMVSPENFVRRGGPSGDILAYMPKHWYEQRKREYAAMNAKQTQASVDRLEQLKEEINGGKFDGGRLGMQLTGKHPTHTMANIVNPTD